MCCNVHLLIARLAVPMAQMILSPGRWRRNLGRRPHDLPRHSDQEKGRILYIRAIIQSEEEAGPVVKRISDDQASGGVYGDEQRMRYRGQWGHMSRLLVGKRSPWPKRLLGFLAPTPVFTSSSSPQ